MVHALGWTLLHFCWQGAAVAGLLWCVLGLMGGKGTAMRYGAACCALGLMVAAPLVTFCKLAAEARQAGLAGTAPAIDWVITVVPGAGDQGGAWMERMAKGLDGAAPWLPWVWMAGVLVFLVRLNLGLVVARGMRASGTDEIPAELLVRFEALKTRLGVRRAVRLLRSSQVAAPAVIGWLRPVVLMPVGCLMRLSTAQVEALLVHELAHIRRHDYLVNVLQSMVEAVLFYHPAVWWVSKQVRWERECRCDRMAVEVGGDALGYARALSFLETRRAFLHEVALGANGGVLTMRIKRLLGYRESSVVSQGAAFTLLAAAIVMPGMYMVTAARAQQGKLVPAVLVRSQTEETAAQAAPAQSARAEEEGLRASYKAWLDEDVLWIIAPAERHAFLGLRSDEERDHFIAQFWERRNPEPGAGRNGFREEHYRRIAYANEHFAAATAGWRSDRGHVYIAYGRPESIDSHPAAQVPYEVWHYESVKGLGEHVDLEFVDACHCGAYSLKPLPGKKLSSTPAGGGTVQAVAYRGQDGPMRIGAGVMAGQMLTHPHPAYPEAAKVAGVDGAVVLKAVISKEGHVEQLQVVSGPEMLRVSAIDAVRQWTYNPYLLNGEPRDVETTITVNYSLGNRSGTSISGSSSSPGSSRSSGASGSASASSYSGPWIGSNPHRVPPGVMAGQLLSQVTPVYPPEAKQKGIQGSVVLRATITTEGRVKNLELLSEPSDLTHSAIDAVRQWVYKPYLLNGEPQEVETTITVNYTLDGVSTGLKAVVNGATAPAVTHMEDPVYTEEARTAKVSGDVLLNLVVDENGNPTHVRVVHGIGHGLDEKAIEAVKQYKFKPAMREGKPVMASVNLEVNFKIF